MADKLLSAVIQLENLIQQQFQQEQVRAAAWLADVRTEQEEHTRQTLREQVEEDERSHAAAAASATQKAEALVSGENLYCNRLEEIRDHVLLGVLRQQLHRILPEQVDDHQDV